MDGGQPRTNDARPTSAVERGAGIVLANHDWTTLNIINQDLCWIKEPELLRAFCLRETAPQTKCTSTSPAFQKSIHTNASQPVWLRHPAKHEG